MPLHYSPSMASRPSGAIPSLFLLSAIWPLHFLPYSFSTATNEHYLRPIILDQSQCPQDWSTAGDQCVQLQFVPTRREQVDEKCESLGAQLADVADGEGEANREMLQDLSDLLEESLEAGVNELIWMVGAGMLWPEWDETGERVRFGSLGEGQREHGDETRKVLALQQKRLRGDGPKSRFEVIIVQPPAVHPFICQLLPLWRRLLLYEQSMLPKGAPRLEEQPRSSYFFDPNSPDTNSSFLSLPCSASGSPSPTVRWFRNGGEEIDLHSQSARFIVSGGALLVPVPFLSPVSPSSFHCTVSNSFGTLRGHSTTVRPAFIEPFQELRLDAYPLMTHGRRAGGTKLECNAPTHYPRSFAFSWVRGGSYGKFVEVSARVFISMDGTLFFSYNVREDEDSYACTLSLPATQSAQLGPFFRLLLPLGHIAPNLKAARGKGPHHHPHAFAPRIDEFQPQIFPEVPTRGDSVFLECFAYGFPVPTYQWSRADGQPLPSGRHRLLNFGRILRLDSAEMGDSSRYRCSVQNRLGLSSAEIRLTIHTPPALLRPLTSRMVAPGHSTTFQCPIADGAGMESLVEWFHDGVPLVPLLLNEADRRRFKLSGEGRELSILDVRSSDAGLIQCMASDDVGSVSSSALLVVATLSPRFHSNVIPSRLSIAKGAVLSLPCLFQSSPPGKGRWTKRGDTEKGQQIRSDRDQKLSGREIAVLNLRNVQMDDSGEYECEAVNNLGIAKAAVKVEVIEKPHVSVFAENSDWSNANQKFACEVEFRCASAEECPEGLFDWQFNDRPIRSLSGSEMIRIRQDDERMEKDRAIWVRQRSELEVDEHFAKGHVGRFSCHSLFGGATTELRPPSLAFASLVLSVVEVGTSDATLSWRILHNAPNGGQNSPKWRRFHEDKVPASELAAFGGQTFELELRTKSVRTWSVLKEVRVPGGTDWVGQFHMDGLEPNQRYQFRLRPTVEGARAISTSKWVKTDQSVPGEAVQNIRFRMLDDSRLLLEWDPVEKTHQSAPNLRYNVTWSTLTSWHSRMVTEPRLLIGLSTPAAQEQTNCALLEVGVRPENERGPGTERTNTVIRASAKEPQRYATDLRMDSVNATHLNLSWSWQNVDPCENAIGAKIMCEEVGKEGRQNSTDHQRPVDEHSPPHQSVPSEYTQWLVHSLRPLREYECRVVAFDQYGRMGPIRAVEVRGWTKERAPEGRPEISFVRVRESGNGTYAVLVDWKSVELKLTAEGLAVHSAPNGSPTADDRSWDRGYKLFVYVSETAEQPILLRLTEAELNDPEKPSARVDGLRPMFFYTIQIAAFNSGGIGPLSERIPVRIGARHQLNPDLVTAMEGNGATSDGRGRRRMPFAMLRLLTTMASLIKLCRRHWR